jgi:hypothetical protein
LELKDWILQQHSVAHFLIDQEIVQGVPHDLWTKRPDADANSLAWLIWHVARCEDVAVNLVVRRHEQVLTRGKWSDRPGLADARVGTGLGDDEVTGFGNDVNLDDLNAYRRAVRDDTAGWLRTADLTLLEEKPDLESVLSQHDMFPEAASWVRDLWRSFTTSLFLNWVAIGHTYMHVGEMQSIRSALGIKGR